LVRSGDPDALAIMNAATEALEAKEKVVHDP
jgi:hypothetical protein